MFVSSENTYTPLMSNLMMVSIQPQLMRASCDSSRLSGLGSLLTQFNLRLSSFHLSRDDIMEFMCPHSYKTTAFVHIFPPRCLSGKGRSSLPTSVRPALTVTSLHFSFQSDFFLSFRDPFKCDSLSSATFFPCVALLLECSRRVPFRSSFYVRVILQSDLSWTPLLCKTFFFFVRHLLVFSLLQMF